MTIAADPAPLQEDLALVPSGAFEFEVAVEDLGISLATTELLAATGPLVVLDFEATGLEPGVDELIEAGAVRIEAGASSARIFNTTIHTRIPLTPFIRRLTGLCQADVSEAPPIAEVAPALLRFLDGAGIVAHNAAFERKFLEVAIHPSFRSGEYLDTVELLGLVYPDSPNMKLDTFCRRMLGRSERHRALDDALDTLRVVDAVVAEARRGVPRAANAMAAMRHFQPTSPWLARLTGLPSAARLSEPPAAMGAQGKALAPVPLDHDAILARLRDVDAVREVMPDYECREGQLAYFEHVWDVFAGRERGGVALCEAGTGIGKTLAYLSVAIPFAQATGEQVIISTSSKVLQTQILEKDIPAAARALGYPDLRFAVMKGRGNYICRRKLDSFLEEAEADRELIDSGQGAAAAVISAFAHSTGHGEIDRIPTVLFQLNPGLERFARDVTSRDATECSRAQCETTRASCVFREARRRLEGARIAVVNHDLLLRWPPDYPPLRHLILDEAHELVEKADRAYARSAEGVEICHRVDAVLADRKLADRAMVELGHKALDLVADFGEAARRLVKTDAQFQFSRDEVLITNDGMGSQITAAATDLIDVLAELARRLAEASDDDASPAAGASETFIDAAHVLGQAFPFPATDDWVFRLRGLARASTNSWRLVATPVSPAADFQMHVLDAAETVFATSATLSVGDAADGAVGELDLPNRAAPRYVAWDPVPSPFDYANHLLVVFLTDRADPGRLVERTTAATEAVARRLGGRTLALFTARDRMLRVADDLQRRLADEGITCITPASGNADPHELVQTFLDSERAVLLGARSFWQGVDIAGDACQAVVIEKLPFDVPGDPLLDRRARLIEAEGGSSFGDQTMPRMLLRLKQMMGRLIRTPQDRGVIIVVESRAEKSYFRRILDALPPGAGHVEVKLEQLGPVLDDFIGRAGLG